MKSFVRTLSIATLMALGGLALAQQPAQAAMKLDIQAQPISDALNEFARQSGLQVFFLASQETQGVMSTALRGSYADPQVALGRLLANTGLRFEYLDSRTIAVRLSRPDGAEGHQPTAGASGSGIAPLRLAQVDSSPGWLNRIRLAAAPEDAAETPPADSGEETVGQIIIRGARTSTATKMDAPIISIPQNIQVMSSKFLDDIGADLLEDALRHVAGVSVGGYYNGWDYFRIRGFDGISYLDGMRTDTLGINAEVFGIDRIEVLKGPSSTLYGEGLLSGMVNIVSKKPKKAAFLDASFTTGKFNFTEGTLDFGGSLNSAQTVYARLPILYREDGTFVDFADGLKRFYIAPSLTLELGERTRMTFLTTYQKDRNEIAFPLPGRGTVLPNVNGKIPRDRFIGDGTDPGHTANESYALGYQVSHDFNDALAFRQSVRYRNRDTDWERLVYPWFMEANQQVLQRFPYYIDDSNTRDISADTGLEFRFSTGRIRQHMTVGVDYTQRRSHEISRFNFSNPNMPLDLFNPVNDGAATVVEADLFPSPFAGKERSVGFYLQNLMQLTERLNLMLGGRYQKVKGGSDFTGTDVGNVDMIGGSAFVPNVGLNFEIKPGLHAYASYSEAFKGQFASRVVGGGKADPEEGVQYELGLKAGLFDNRVNGTLSVYELTRQNVLQAAFNQPGFNVLTGEQRSRGIELDSQFLVTDNWEVVASAAYTDAEVTKAEPTDPFTSPRGAPLRNVPKESLSVWSKYTFASGALKGLAASIGGSYYSRQQGKAVSAPTPDPTDIESFYLPSYSVVDANLAYQWNKARLALTLNNLLDEKYFIGSYSENYVLPGTPRSVRLTVGWSY